jgi:DNA repair exonuclease SbcCD ATPase subunit
LGEIAEDLGQTIKRLKAAEARGEAWRDAMSSLDSINERIAKMAESVKGMNRMLSGFSNGENPFGGAGGSGGVLEEGSTELPEVPFMKEIEERLHELLGEGVDPEEISEIISNEFPGVHVEIRSGGAEDPQEEEEMIEEEEIMEEEITEEEITEEEITEEEITEEEAKKRVDAKRRGIAELMRGLSENRDRLEDLQKRLKNLRARVKESEGEVRAEIKKSIKEVRTTTKSIRHKLADLTKKLTEMKKK